MNHPALKALYFPFSRCFSELTLKRAVLLFDELIFVDPIAVDIAYDNPSTTVIPYDPDHIMFRSPRGYTPKDFDSDPSWLNVRSQYEFLRKKNLIQLFDPSRLIASHGDLLAASSLHRPRSLIEAFDRGADPPNFRMNDPHLLLWIMPSKRVPRPDDEQLGEKFQDLLRASRTTILKERPWGPDPYDLPPDYVAIPVDRAIPLLIDEALLASEELTAVPLTDDRTVAAYMIERFADIPTIYSAGPTDYIQSERIERVIFASLAMQTFTSVVADADLERWSLEDVYSFRMNMSEHLDRFRSLLWQLTYELTRTPGEPGFEREIRGSVLTKIEQPLADLVMDMQAIRRTALLSAAAEGAKKAFPAAAAGLPTLTVGALTGLSFTGLVVGAAAAALTSLGLAVPAAVTAIEQRRRAERNALFYLAKLGQHRHQYEDESAFQQSRDWWERNKGSR